MDTLTLALVLNYAKKQAEEAKKEGFKVQVEQDRSILDRAGEEKIFYFLPKSITGLQDGYDEFVYTNNNWEKVGATDVDLSSYATKSEVGDLNNLPTTDKSSIVSAISETFTSVSNGKLLVASAITDKGVSTSSDATFEIMAQNIEAIPSGTPVVSNPALVLWDWEGTKLAAYSREDALALEALPNPSDCAPYSNVDHELLIFQGWTRNLTNIKTWVRNHSNQSLGVGAIYTTTDGQNHDHWNNPRLTDAKSIYMQKRGVTSIGGSAFQNCYSLTAINIPDGVTSIGGYAFQNCYPLTAINIPDGVTSIGNDAFVYCYSLTAINIPDGVTSIGGNAFKNCTSLTAINIPDGVTSIGDSAFSYCFSLTAINIPDGVISIGNGAFSVCLSLTQINIPDSVTSIGNGAFQNCYSLTQINIPDSVTSIGNDAFNSCYSLCDVPLESKPTLSSRNAFNSLPTNYRIYVPRSNLSWFETATNWSAIYTQGHIVAIEDYIDYLESIGFNVDEYKEVTA